MTTIVRVTRGDGGACLLNVDKISYTERVRDGTVIWLDEGNIAVREDAVQLEALICQAQGNLIAKAIEVAVLALNKAND